MFVEVDEGMFVGTVVRVAPKGFGVLTLTCEAPQGDYVVQRSWPGEMTRKWVRDTLNALLVMRAAGPVLIQSADGRRAAILAAYFVRSMAECSTKRAREWVNEMVGEEIIKKGDLSVRRFARV